MVPEPEGLCARRGAVKLEESARGRADLPAEDERAWFGREQRGELSSEGALFLRAEKVEELGGEEGGDASR